MRPMYFGVIFFLVSVEGLHHSCKDIYASNPRSASGTYQIMNRKQEPFTVYCDFYTDYGYTYISNMTAVDIDIADLYTTSSHAMVRQLYVNGEQKETKMEQISKYSHQYPLSFQYNETAGYQAPQNYAKLAPYLYLGFLPVTIARGRTQQGYRASGRDYLFTNCDSNPNSYMAFYFNPNRNTPVGYYTHCCDSTLMHDWVTHANSIPQTRYLPPEFYFFFEFHMGGCGGYAIPLKIIPEVKGAALGLRFDYDNPCSKSPCLNGGQCFAEGTEYVCECSVGYTGQNCQNADQDV